MVSKIMTLDDYDELGYPKKKPEKKDYDIKDYPGMSKEAEEDYNKRQAEPLFKTSKDMVPMEQVRKVFDNQICGYSKRDGCKVLTRDKSFYACIVHQTFQSIGTDFFTYYNLITDEELEKMNASQHQRLEERHAYMTRWLDSFSQGHKLMK
jgi:hypothetical protein